MDLLKRLTTDKPNTMMELAFNSCYVDNDRAARYRDFSTDIDARDLARKLMVAFGQWTAGEDNELIDDDIFDDTMLYNLMYDAEEPTGLIALFYRNLWAMAELRERLKMYEDAEEQGLLVKLPCKVGDTVYCLVGEERILEGICKEFQVAEEHEMVWVEGKEFEFWVSFKRFNKTVFLTKEEAEAALKKMEE